MNKIKKVDENKKVTIYDNIKEAAKSIDTNFDLWKVEMLIIYTMQTKKRAFKCHWYKVA